jgi:hypothetical protein
MLKMAFVATMEWIMIACVISTFGLLRFDVQCASTYHMLYWYDHNHTNRDYDSWSRFVPTAPSHLVCCLHYVALTDAIVATNRGYDS